jgi:hypothetical protein
VATPGGRQVSYAKGVVGGARSARPLCCPQAGGTRRPRCRPCHPQSWRQPAMTVSDKLSVKWRPSTPALQVRLAFPKEDATNKSVPRTRKEKCQTRRSACRPRGRRRRWGATGLGVRPRFRSFLRPKPQLRRSLRLTLLTVARQICQTRTLTGFCWPLHARDRLTFVAPPRQICQTIKPTRRSGRVTLMQRRNISSYERDGLCHAY